MSYRWQHSFIVKRPVSELIVLLKLFYMYQYPPPHTHTHTQQGIRDRTNVMYNTALGVIFGVKKYADSLLKVVESRGIKLNFKRNFVEITEKEAVFENTDLGTMETYEVWCSTHTHTHTHHTVHTHTHTHTTHTHSMIFSMPAHRKALWRS